MAESGSGQTEGSGSFLYNFCSELVSSPLNLALLGLCAFLLYKIIVGQRKPDPLPQREPELPKLKKQDMTLEQLREYDGKGEDERILVAANGKIFDVTRGKRFYGPGMLMPRDTEKINEKFTIRISTDVSVTRRFAPKTFPP